MFCLQIQPDDRIAAKILRQAKGSVRGYAPAAMDDFIDSRRIDAQPPGEFIIKSGLTGPTNLPFEKGDCLEKKMWQKSNIERQPYSRCFVN